MTRPDVSTIIIIRPVSGACILRESISISAVRAPVPVECMEILCQKLITVTAITRIAEQIIKDLMNTGI